LQVLILSAVVCCRVVTVLEESDIESEAELGEELKGELEHEPEVQQELALKH
jgi:hypothetical protein